MWSQTLAHTRPGPEIIPIWAQRCVAWFACTAEVDQASKVPTDAFLTLLAFLCRHCALLLHCLSSVSPLCLALVLLVLWVTKYISPSLLFVSHEICSPLGQSAKFVLRASYSPPKYFCNVWLSEYGFCITRPLGLLDAAYLLTRSTVRLKDIWSMTLRAILFMVLNTSALSFFACL